MGGALGQLIGEIPAHDRPRERLLSHGPAVLSDRELLAIVIRDGARRTSAVDLAGELLADFGGVANLSKALPEELAARRGIGMAKATAVAAAFELGRRSKLLSEPRVLRTASDVAEIAQGELAGARRERVLVLVCDAANQLVRTLTIAEGAIDKSQFPIREILNAVLRHDGRAFAVAHNHPSGDATPSSRDEAATEEIGAAASTVGLRFLGHVVVAASTWSPIPALRS